MMRLDFLAIWGCAKGPVTRLAPQTRLLAGFSLFFVCMIAAPDTTIGFSFLSISVLAWLIVCRIPHTIFLRVFLFGLVVFLPFFLLIPWIEVSPRSSSWFEGPELLKVAVVPWRIFAKGLGGMLVSVATISSVNPGDFHEGIRRLPLPRSLVGLLTQIIHQTGLLIDETRRIAAVMAVRGATGKTRTAWRILTSLPKVWLPRVMFRADRVAAAMDLRGFGPNVPCFRHIPMRIMDWTALVSVGAWFVLAVTSRLGVAG